MTFISVHLYFFTSLVGLLVTCPFPSHQINDQQQLKELVLLSLSCIEHILITLMKKPNQGNILNRAKSFKVPFGVWKMLLVVRSSFVGRMFFVTSKYFFFFRSHLSSSIISSHTSKHVNRRPPANRIQPLDLTLVLEHRCSSSSSFCSAIL